MKKNVLLFFSVVFMLAGASIASAQGKYGADSAECIKYLSYYNEYYKQKNYDDALPNWRKAYSLCPPTANQTMLINGTALYRRLINANRNNPVYLEGLIDTLMTLHDIRAQYYPKYAVTARNNKGLDMINYVKDDPQKLYDEFKKIIAENKSAVKPQILLFELNTSCQLYQNGTLMAEDVMQDYNDVMQLLDQMKQTPEIEKIRTDCETLFIASNVANCENLIELFTPRFEAAPDDLQLATNIVKMLSTTEGCTDNDLFKNAANTMHRLSPTYTSAHFLYQLYSAEGDVKTALQFIDEAIGYTGLASYRDKLVAEARETGMAKTMFGRIRTLADINSKNFTRRSFAERTAMNTPIQGSAADIIKLAMNAVQDELERRGLKSRLLVQVHDELVLEVPADEREEVETLLKDTMEHIVTLSVPLVVDIHCGRNWEEAK